MKCCVCTQSSWWEASKCIPSKYRSPLRCFDGGIWMAARQVITVLSFDLRSK